MKLIKIDGRNAKHHHFGNAINGREDVQVDGRTNDSVVMDRLECEGRDDIGVTLLMNRMFSWIRLWAWNYK